MSVLASILSWTGIAVLIVYVVLTGIGGALETLYHSRVPLPEKLTRYLRERRIRETVELLSQLSYLSKAARLRQAAQYQELPASPGKHVYERDIQQTAKTYLRKGQFLVGRVRDKEFRYFIDFMEASTVPRDADRLARALVSFIKDEMASLEQDPPIFFDCVVAPKGGSPVLAFLVARLLGSRCVLFRGADSPKVTRPDQLQHYFDGEIRTGQTAILVDDSSTGGRMLADAIQKLGEMDVAVKHAFILFEPKTGNAREVMA